MKKLTKAWQSKSVKELLQGEQNLRHEIAKLGLGMKSNPPKDTNTLIKKRKNLAVVLTILTEKKELEAISTESKSKK